MNCSSRPLCIEKHLQQAEVFSSVSAAAEDPSGEGVSEAKSCFSTGSPPLDAALGGGLPYGHIVEVREGQTDKLESLEVRSLEGFV